jgi:hypothetical protein
MKHWWPAGHTIRWEHTFIHELHHLLSAIRDDLDVPPLGADFEDGYRTAEVCDAITTSSATGARQELSYQPKPGAALTSAAVVPSPKEPHSQEVQAIREQPARGLAGPLDERRIPVPSTSPIPAEVSARP